MFDIGGGELILILMAVLLFFGPKKIPELAKSVGNAVRHIRRAQQEFSRQIHTMSEEVDQVTSSITNEVSTIANEVSSIHTQDDQVGYEHHNNLDPGNKPDEITLEPMPIPTIRPVEGALAQQAYTFPTASEKETDDSTEKNTITDTESDSTKKNTQ
ncbi:MAG: twin-arginine translocase TatA/TatE family subunit [Candidatus Kapabacteria bacterium]|nr:twin-arginine translocase TatA/TatE family subunit [Candidatus Kapabacteria bacterium]